MSVLQQIKRQIVTWSRARLRQAGFTLERPPENAPAGLEACLRELLDAVSARATVLYHGASRPILEHLRDARIAWTSELPPCGTLALAIVDLKPGEAIDWPRLAALLDPQGSLLVRFPVAGVAQLASLATEWEHLGLRMIDVPEYPRSARPVEAIERVAVLLAPANTPAPAGPAAARVDELRTWLGGPIGGWTPARRLAGPTAGPTWDAVLNPGALARPDGTLLLCRVEDATWTEMKPDEAVFMRRCPPRLLELDSSGVVRTTRSATWTEAPSASTHRLEDFRLFTHAGQILSNHAILRLPAPARAGKPIALDQLETRVGFSVLDPLRAELRFLGEPRIPRTLGRTEKNWVCFSRGEELFLLYSPAPYRLYRCTDWGRLEFKEQMGADWSLPGASPDLPPLRNSINPVVYDAEHWLHVVHRVYPDKRYAYWPVLISRQTLRPVRSTRQPIACGAWSGGDGLLYLSAALAGSGFIELYFGAEDCATGHTRVDRRALDAAWQAVEIPAGSQRPEPVTPRGMNLPFSSCSQPSHGPGRSLLV